MKIQVDHSVFDTAQTGTPEDKITHAKLIAANAAPRQRKSATTRSCIPSAGLAERKEELKAKNIELVAVSANPIDALWAAFRPAAPVSQSC